VHEVKPAAAATATAAALAPSAPATAGAVVPRIQVGGGAGGAAAGGAAAAGESKETPVASPDPFPGSPAVVGEDGIPTVDEFGVPLSKNAIEKLRKKANAKAARAAAAAAKADSALSADVPAASAIAAPAAGAGPPKENKKKEKAPKPAAAAAGSAAGSAAGGSAPAAAPKAAPISAAAAAAAVAMNASHAGDAFLAFVTIIEEHDTSGEVGGLAGRFIAHVAGKESPLPWRWARPAVMRMGLIGFQVSIFVHGAMQGNERA